MNVEELESIIRDELRRDAANAPAGRQLRAAVLDAVVDLPMAERPVRFNRVLETFLAEE